MKLSLFFLTISLFQLQANTSYAQKAKVSMAYADVPLERVLEEIESQTEFRFFYNIDDINAKQKVSIKADQQLVTQVLNTIFQSTLIQFKVTGKQIVLTKRSDPTNTDAQQQFMVNGSITDEQGAPLPGATVRIKGINRGVAADFDGNYSITVPSEESMLVFTSIGFQRLEVTVGNQRTINVQLTESVSELDEVVVNAGYYSVKERESTGNIEKVTAEEMELQPIVNPIQALQGRMAGVEVVQQSGVSGLASNIRIRGQNSLRMSPGDNGNLPLYIVDGVPVNSAPVRTSGLLTNNPGLDPLNSLNLSNVESIEVLKDADATAIYGSRGANGVVLITTRRSRSREGRVNVEAKLYSGISKASNQMDLMNTSQYLQMRNQALENDGTEATEWNAPDLFWDQGRYTDWQDVMFGGTAVVTDMNLAVSGGNETTSFLIGGSYHDEGTVFPGDFGYNKVTGNANINHTSLDQKFRLQFSINYGIDNNELFNNTFVNQALILPPNAPRLYTEEGELNWEGWVWEANPFSQLRRLQSVNSNNILSNLVISYELLPNLRIKTNFGYSNLSSEELLIAPLSAYNPANWDRTTASSTLSNVDRRSWIVEPQLTYQNAWGKLNMDLVIGSTFQKDRNDLLVMVGQGFSNERLVGNLAAAQEVRVNTQESIDYRYNAGFGRIGLNWDSTYFLNFTGRRDGSSRFGPNKRFANFGAIGAAWIFSNESFIEDNVSFLSFGKLRGSYGSTGSDQIPDYGFMDTYESTSGPGGLYPTALTNPNYSWEVNKKLEAAIELGLFENRINFDINWYRNRSSNQLVGYPLPYSTGFSSVQANFPATVQNSGWEFGFRTLNLKSGDFYWETYVNLTVPKTDLVAFDNIEQTPYQNVYRVGEPLDIAIQYQYDGIDAETGLYQVEDINGDESLNYDDRVVIKNLGRKYYGGLNNTFRFKGISLQFLLEYVNQDSSTYLSSFTAPGYYGNKPNGMLDAWTLDNRDTDIQTYSQTSAANSAYTNALRSGFGISDASFLRLKTISLSYQLPEQTLNTIGLESLRLFLHGQNLLTFTKYEGLDPQTGNSLPPMRTITMGLQVKL